MEEKQKEKGLSVTTVWFMIAVALFFDVLQALLLWAVGIGYLMPVVFYPTFWLWFKFHGISFFSMKRAPVLGINTLIELIPGADLFPGFTVMVARIALENKLQSIVPGADITKLDIMNRK